MAYVKKFNTWDETPLNSGKLVHVEADTVCHRVRRAASQDGQFHRRYDTGVGIIAGAGSPPGCCVGLGLPYETTVVVGG